MSGSVEVKVSEIEDTSDIGFILPCDFSFFQPYIRYFVKETLEIGGEAYVSRTPDGTVSGIFLYDDFEKVGTIYTRSREAFDFFYGLKSFNLLFAEIKTEFENEIYDVYTIDLDNVAVDHRFSHEISVADEQHTGEIERFMVSTHPKINRKWVRVALKNGDKCFIVRLTDEIAGLGWLSLVNGIGRIHSLFVRPQFRKIGIGEDILYARLLWLKSKHARSAFSEISRNNSSSLRIATKAQMKVSGQVFGYFRKNVRSQTTQGAAHVPRF